ncbi:peptidoglycan DD-metalloendopeptidase family protein [Chitinophaga oryzae]|uniref:Peptidoglycan DD-metalloendopeptidase family protein n=1 Tax=Chitinophaga oryzae TaxID=2725414 RepID=A0AAE6ZN36_9BACT|nr:peptidoglycan DD-metalloendopeptidase family protein [Chitinophaga oryzae]QJB35198.1 peptidoglycan DD-metalloendopeptidase family protein [Chitinophaga oryzae]
MIPSCSTARHLVCEGALCSCDKAAAPAPVKVVSHHRYYVHSSGGTDKPVVTTRENDYRALHFSSCLAGGQPAPCMPQLLWQIPAGQQRIALANGAYPLPDNATAQCLRGGRLHFLTHGQLPAGAADSPGLFSADNQPPADKLSINFSPSTPRIVRIKGPAKIRQLHNGSWEALFDRPPADADISVLHWVLENDQGVQEASLHGEKVFPHRFMHDGQYTLRVYGGEDSDMLLTQTIQVAPTGIICSSRTARPGERIRFTVAEAEAADSFRWDRTDEKGIRSGTRHTGPEIEYTFEQTGQYIVRAATGDEVWQQSVTICNNRIRHIHADRTPVSGAVVTFSIAETMFPDITPREQLKLHWKLEGPESTHCAGETTFRHLFTHCGHYTLYAYLYDLQQEAALRFEVKNATVSAAQWTTPNGYIIRQAGYDQDVCLYFEHSGLEKRKVLLEIYARQALHSTLVHSRSLQVQQEAKVSYPLSISSLRLPAGWDNGQLQLDFRLHPTDSIPIGQQAHPRLLLHRKPCIVKACFTDPQEQRMYFITDHQQQIALKIYAVNLTGQQLRVTILRRNGSPPLQRPLTPYPVAAMKPLLEKDATISTQQVVIDKTGTALLPVPLESLSAVSLIYALITLPGHNAVYSQQLLVYPSQQLRLSPATKARSTAVIERVNLPSEQAACQSLVWGSKVSCAFRKKVISIAKKLHADPNHLMTCMAFETGASFLPHLLSGHKPWNTPAVEKLTEGVLGRHAVGLVQFTQQAIDHINKRLKSKITKKQLALMSAEQQLDYVYQYLVDFRGRLGTLEDFYLIILKPEGAGKSENYLVFSKEMDVEKKKPWYAKNKGLDINYDGKITKKEVGVIIYKKYTEGLNYKNTCANSCPLRSTNKANEAQRWHHPTDNVQLRGWYSHWAPERSKYGIVDGRKSGKHQGIDLYAPEGSNVYACVNGTISNNYYSESYGHTVTLEGDYAGSKYYFFYAHLQSKGLFELGEEVAAGTIIGYTGKTGNASGLKYEQEHLHFEVRNKENVKRGFDGRLDPLTIINELNQNEIINPDKKNQYAKYD